MNNLINMKTRVIIVHILFCVLLSICFLCVKHNEKKLLETQGRDKCFCLMFYKEKRREKRWKVCFMYFFLRRWFFVSACRTESIEVSRANTDNHLTHR